MSNNAVQTFAENSENYRRFRPNYPTALIDWVVSLCDKRETVWDCGTGNGQAACALAPHFKTVFATDVSQEQLAHATQMGNVSYSIAPAEVSGLKSASVDLITVATALHWFNFSRFWPEVRRVGRRGAMFVAWGYGASAYPAEIERTVMEPLAPLLVPYWSRGNKIVEDGYRDADILFPFQAIATPAFAVEVDWPINQILGFVKTWSAYKIAARDPAVLALLVDREVQARKRFMDTDTFAIKFPLVMKAARLS